MSTAIRWIIAVLVVAVVGWFVWQSGWLGGKKPNVASNSGQTASTTPAQQAPINGMSASNDASDSAISQDSAAIDAQMSAYTADTASVDSSMNDQQIAQ